MFSRMRLRRIAGALLAPLALLLALPSPSVAAESAADTEVKAAVIYNLLLFIHWSKETAPPKRLRLCVVDGGELSTSLRQHENKTVQGWPLDIRRIAATPEELSSCNVILIEAGNPSALARAAALSRSRPLLVIAEGATAAEHGAMIGLRVEGGRVVFDINTGALAKSGLAASSKLLRLARTLID